MTKLGALMRAQNEAHNTGLQILKIIELYYHPNGEINPFYAAQIRIRTENGTEFINMTFELHKSVYFEGEIDIFTARINDPVSLKKKFNAPVIAAFLDMFIKERGFNVEQLEKKLNGN